MRRNQLVFMGLLVGAIILVSFHGGVISYALFYLCLCVPIVALAYNVYVYKRLQFYQHTPSKIVEKGKVLPYEVIFKNEDYIPFTHVKVNFYEQQCKVEGSHKVKEYYLLPGDEKKLQTTLKCFYRGDYSVGVKEIEIMDFLYLFKITYPVMWSLELNVLPTVVKLKHLSIIPNYEDPKVQYNACTQDMLLESDTRKYIPGDHPKQIHWKALAHQGELLTRRTSTEIKRDNIILMERYIIQEDRYSQLAIEDKILEVVLALAYYLQSTKVAVKVVYEEKELREYEITDYKAFGNFYQTSSKVHFNGDYPLSKVLDVYLMQHPKLDFYILVTHQLTNGLYESIEKAIAYGQELIVLYVAKQRSKAEEILSHKLGAIGVKIYWIRPGDSLEEVIG